MVQHLLTTEHDAHLRNTERPSRTSDIVPRTVVPRAVVRPEALSFHVLSPSQPGPADAPFLGAAYECWTDVWHDLFAELRGLTDVPSDEFSRQHEIGALFHDWECIGLMGYRWVSLSSPIDRDDSYFKVWPSEARARAAEHGDRLFIAGNLTIAEPWRRADGQSVKELLLALAVERFLVSDCDTIVGTTRNNRGMNELGYRLGFTQLAPSVPYHGIEVDLVAFYRDTCTRPPLDAATEKTIATLRPNSAPRNL